MPRWSQDGRWIAFSSDRNGGAVLWIVHADGSSPRAIATQEEGALISPVWTHDGRFVIAARGAIGTSPADLWKYPIDSVAGGSIYGDSVQKKNRKSGNPYGPVASRDGKFLYYSGIASPGAGTQPRGAQVIRRDLAAGKEETITNAPGGALRPALSPDGNMLVFGTHYDGQTALRVRDLTTGRERWLLYPIERHKNAGGSRDRLPGYAFTPDGRAIVIAYGGKMHRVDVATGTSQVIPFTARVALDLAPQLLFSHRVDSAAVRARMIMTPTLSPDGRRLAFSAMGRLNLMDLPHGKPVPLHGASVRGFQPVWSPDGRSLAYVTWDAATGGAVWKISADGSGVPVRLTDDDGSYRDPVWAPARRRGLLG